ncbi:MAG: hypothetical protein COT74_13305 [Bdellovibrionales bacterium CG10_big_fil_rev_8_21_14_0_10_45_34]|nr:MAG: hypothetical protein COT74_13305 [Bdellovibrionales bacterium CG10_big_fil_rev_8_21_14_0_10_45_34]
MIRANIAVVDDDVEMGKLVKEVLTDEGYEVTQYSSALDALSKFKNEPPQVLITDQNMKGVDGLMFIKKVRSDFPSVIPIMMTAFGSVETAVTAVKAGAFHYIQKPFSNDEMVSVARRALREARVFGDGTYTRASTEEFKSVLGLSENMRKLQALLEMIAPASANVLISGESGSGKELVARAIHDMGPRRFKKFVPVNCTAIPENLMESELFGHIKGSFTGAYVDKKGLFDEANGGTMFLDEIGDLSLPLQAKLLRVLQDKKIRSVGDSQLRDVNVRIVAATHRNLRAMVKEGYFREDLFYRLNVIPVTVPSLRERKEDIPDLVDGFIRKFNLQSERYVSGIAPAALDLLLKHSWPGNVRELENVIERAMVLTSGDVIEVAAIEGGTCFETVASAVEKMADDMPTLEKLEERYIRKVLGEVDNKKDDAAKILGISRRTLYRKEKTFGLIGDNDPEPLEDTDDSIH